MDRAEQVQRLIEIMERMNRQIGSRLPEEWPDAELTMPQLRTLVLLSNGPLRMSDIAAQTGSSHSATTAMIDRLVEKGLVHRTHDSKDRRVVICELTPAGTRTINQIWRIHQDRIERIVATLTDQDLATVLRAMEILAGASERMATREEMVELRAASD